MRLGRYHTRHNVAPVVILVSAAAAGAMALAGCMTLEEHEAKKTSALRNGNGGAPYILLDPGHSGTSTVGKGLIDDVSKLPDIQYPSSTPEMQDVFDVASMVQTMLRQQGYNVCMTKKTVNDTVSQRQRADFANSADPQKECGPNGPALAVSIHTDPSSPKSWAAMSPQFVGGYRGGVDATRCAQKKDCAAQYPRTVLSDAALATRSLAATKLLAEERTRSEGRPVPVSNLNFDGRDPLPPGNLSLVQLYSSAPWTYAEYGAKEGGSTQIPLTPAEKTAYATGLVNGVLRAVPLKTA